VKRVILTLLVLAVLPAILFAQTSEAGKPIMDLYDLDINPGDSVHLDSSHVWILKDGVFVDSGAVLSIDPGTIIKGEPGTGANSKYLCVARGGRIRAEGTENKPIVFTGDVDNVDDPYDIAYGTNGLWGGVLILGRSFCNTPTGTQQIEGIPSEETRGEYGGGANPDSLDNSGIFRYVSIRHGGTEIGAANEINGLTMGAVGAGTVIEYVEVYNNYDDGFEWFGGTVNTKYLVSAFNGDDAYDYDEGFRGYHQFWFVIQDSASGNRCGEHDGGTGDEQGTPYAEPYIFNVTYIGGGSNTANADNDHALKIRDNAGAHYANGIIGYFGGDVVDFEDLCGPDGTPHDTRTRLNAGDLTLENMFFWDFGDGSDPVVLFPPESYDCNGDEIEDSTSDFAFVYMTDPANNNSWTVDPMLLNVSRNQVWHALDPRLDPASPANTPGQPEPSDPHFDDVDYHGAFPPAGNKNSLEGLWISNWTYLWQRAHVNLLCGDANDDGSVNISDAVTIINFVFIGGKSPYPYFVADSNCDCSVNVSDAVVVINYVFIGGDSPCQLPGCPPTCVF